MPVDELKAAIGASVSPTRVRVILSLLKELEIVRAGGGGSVRLLKATLTSGNLEAATEAYREKQLTDRDKLEQMMRYGQSAGCRWRQLLEYFGESLAEPCGTCDNCRCPLEAQIARPA